MREYLSGIMKLKKIVFLLMIFHIKIAYYVQINIIQLITIIIFFDEENEYNPLFKNYIDTATIVGNMINKNNIYIYGYLKIKYIFYITLLLSKFLEGYC